MSRQYEQLTREDVDFFMSNGYVVIKDAFTQEKSAEWMNNMWVRLGMDPNDKTTWKQERTHMPAHNRELVHTFAPKAWAAIKDLLGGEERIDSPSSSWGDSFIVNLGTPELESEDIHIDPTDLDNWHVDGDFFVHFLDSPEQALLVIPVFAPISPRGGGTFIAPDGIGMIARYLSEHPEGVLPTGLSFTPSTSTFDDPKDHPEYWSHLKEIKKCTKFVEITGDTGDVVLMHPLMLHSASKNHTRVPRVITNPPVSLKEPFNFNRENPEDYSIVERKTLSELGVERLDFRITTERRRVVPARVARQNKMLEEEKKRLEQLKVNQAQVPVAPNDVVGQPIIVA
ncbi:hypothetical protein PNOK_0706100 [Pyrrhoderma noxium]|uniref:Clavaminate synthase n=1 Tax=Pyrrhoderma noxium TaxID=2282107 RepID=A0A286UBQ6_9AGAM|nr:hypothetical protein PNOK_0706100 [Pyrrhoderma noxium]